MHHRHQHMRFVRDMEKRCPHWYFGGQIKALQCCRLDSSFQLADRPCGGIDKLPTEIGVLGFNDHLLGHTVSGSELRA